MKKTKIITSFLAVSLIFCFLFTLTACTGYESELEEDDTMSICFGYNKRKNDAFIIEFYWHGNFGEDMNIDLPNTYKGAPVTSLGGGYVGIGAPAPLIFDFFEKSDLKKELLGDIDYNNGYLLAIDINTQDEVYACLKESLDDITEFEIKDVVFNLHIGSNLQKFGRQYFDSIKPVAYNKNDANEVLTVYVISFEITVDEQNEYFYSDDLGRMYYKENDKLVDYFLYHNRSEFPEHSLSSN